MNKKVINHSLDPPSASNKESLSESKSGLNKHSANEQITDLQKIRKQLLENNSNDNKLTKSKQSMESVRTSLTSEELYQAQLNKDDKDMFFIDLGLKHDLKASNKDQTPSSMMEFTEGLRQWDDQFTQFQTLYQQQQCAILDFKNLVEDVKQFQGQGLIPERRGAAQSAVASPQQIDQQRQISVSELQVNNLEQMTRKITKQSESIISLSKLIKDSTLRVLIDTEWISNSKLQNASQEMQKMRNINQKQHHRADKYKTKNLEYEFEMQEKQAQIQGLMDRITEQVNENEEQRNRRMIECQKYENRILQIEKALSGLIKQVSAQQQQNLNQIDEDQRIQNQTHSNQTAQNSKLNNRRVDNKRSSKGIKSPKNIQGNQRNNKSMLDKQTRTPIDITQNRGTNHKNQPRSALNKSYDHMKINKQGTQTSQNTNQIIVSEVFKVYNLIKKFRNQDEYMRNSSIDLICSPNNNTISPKNMSKSLTKSIDKAFVVYQSDESQKQTHNTLGRKSPIFSALSQDHNSKILNNQQVTNHDQEQNQTIELDMSFSKEIVHNKNTSQIQGVQNDSKFNQDGEYEADPGDNQMKNNDNRNQGDNSVNYSNIFSQINNSNFELNQSKESRQEKFGSSGGPMIVKFQVQNNNDNNDQDQNPIDLSSIILAVSDDQPEDNKQIRKNKKNLNFGQTQKLFNTTMKISEILKMTNLNSNQLKNNKNSKTPKYQPMKSPFSNNLNQEMKINMDGNLSDISGEGINSNQEITEDQNENVATTDPDNIFSMVNISQDDAQSLINLLKDHVKVKIGKNQFIKIPKLNLNKLSTFPKEVQDQLNQHYQNKNKLNGSNCSNTLDLECSKPTDSNDQISSSNASQDQSEDNQIESPQNDNLDNANESSFQNITYNQGQSQQNHNLHDRRPNAKIEEDKIIELMQIDEQLDKSIRMPINDLDNSQEEILNSSQKQYSKEEIAHMNRLRNNINQQQESFLTQGNISRAHNLTGLDNFINLSNILPDQSLINNQRHQNNMNLLDSQINGDFDKFIDSNIVDSQLLPDSKSRVDTNMRLTSDLNLHSENSLIGQNNSNFNQIASRQINIQNQTQQDDIIAGKFKNKANTSQQYNGIIDDHKDKAKSIGNSVAHSIGNSIGLSGFLDMTNQNFVPFEIDNQIDANESLFDQQRARERSKRRQQLSKGTLGFVNDKKDMTHKGSITSKANQNKPTLWTNKYEQFSVKNNRNKEKKFPQSTKGATLKQPTFTLSNKNVKQRDICNMSNFQSSNKSGSKVKSRKSKKVYHSVKPQINYRQKHIGRIPQSTKNQKYRQKKNNIPLSSTLNNRGRQQMKLDDYISQGNKNLDIDISNQINNLKSTKNQDRLNRSSQIGINQNNLVINTLYTQNLDALSIGSMNKSIGSKNETNHKVLLPRSKNNNINNSGIDPNGPDFNQSKNAMGYNSLLSAEVKSNKSGKPTTFTQNNQNKQVEGKFEDLNMDRSQEYQLNTEQNKNVQSKSKKIGNQQTYDKSKSSQENQHQQNVLNQLMQNQKKIQMIQNMKKVKIINTKNVQDQRINRINKLQNVSKEQGEYFDTDISFPTSQKKKILNLKIKNVQKQIKFNKEPSKMLQNNQSSNNQQVEKTQENMKKNGVQNNVQQLSVINNSKISDDKYQTQQRRVPTKLRVVSSTRIKSQKTNKLVQVSPKQSTSQPKAQNNQKQINQKANMINQLLQKQRFKINTDGEQISKSVSASLKRPNKVKIIKPKQHSLKQVGVQKARNNITHNQNVIINNQKLFDQLQKVNNSVNLNQMSRTSSQQGVVPQFDQNIKLLQLQKQQQENKGIKVLKGQEQNNRQIQQKSTKMKPNLVNNLVTQYKQ